MQRVIVVCMRETLADNKCTGLLQFSLLEHQPRAVGLLERLGIAVLSPSSLISRALLPEFLSMEEAVQKSVLDYIVRHWNGLDHNELTEPLKAAPFVATGDVLVHLACS